VPNTGTASVASQTYTLANTPSTPTLDSATTSTLTLTNAENGNPSSSPVTYFAVQVVTTNPNDATWLNQYVNASGDPSASAVWRTDAQLDGLVLRGLESSTIYGVRVKARNENNTETAFGAEGQGTTASAGGGATNISASSSEHLAWNDVLGWIDLYVTGSVIVTNSKLKGYALSSAGDISLDCATTRSGNICGSSNFQVLNDGSGNLSGKAWNDTYGWFLFCGGQGTADCSGTTTTYQVRIDPETGIFTDNGLRQNFAWNSAVGWVSFNCDNTGSCGISDYKTKTTWVATSTSGYVESATFDTQQANGAQLNSVLWQGNLPGGTSVRFQFAVANSSSGPWTYRGPDGTSATYYAPSGPGESLPLDYTYHNGYRYFRYKMTLVSNLAKTLTPRVDEVIVNWSP
jgi:hypothetical protein